MRLSHPNSEPERPPPSATPSAPNPVAFTDAGDGVWAALVKARETRPLFRAMPRERREAYYRLHDQLIVGLSGSARFDPAIVMPGTLQAWIWVSAKDDGDAHDLETALHVLLALAIEQGLRPKDGFPRWPRNPLLPSALTH
nr:hypothetical protein [uncultured Brevundimonas sp.]